MMMTRRTALATGATLATGVFSRNAAAEQLESVNDLAIVNPPRPLPEILFTDADGRFHSLSDFSGHAFVLNLWATWCVPCVAEMPALVALARVLAPNDIAVLPLSSDRGGAKSVQGFYQREEIRGLPVLIDPKAAAQFALKVRGIPTTLIVDKSGREVARLEGAADWSTKAAADRVRALVRG